MGKTGQALVVALAYGVSDLVGPGDGVETQFDAFAGGLHDDGAVAEDVGNETGFLDGDVLNFLDAEITDGSMEETLLLDIYDSPVSDNPGVKVSVSPSNEEVNPQKQKPSAVEEEHQVVRFLCKPDRFIETKQSIKTVGQDEKEE